MLEEEVIRCREGKKFEEKYLRKGFKSKISIIRILDSRRENFRLSKAYEHKVDIVKTYDYVKDYFADSTVLVAAIKKYHEISKIQKGEYTLLDLLKK